MTSHRKGPEWLHELKFDCYRMHARLDRGIGPGQVLAVIIAPGAVRVVRLTEVFRQAAESRIIVNAHRINQGLMPELAPLESGDFYFVNAAEAEEGVRKLLTMVQKPEKRPQQVTRSVCPKPFE